MHILLAFPLHNIIYHQPCLDKPISSTPSAKSHGRQAQNRADHLPRRSHTVAEEPGKHETDGEHADSDVNLLTPITNEPRLIKLLTYISLTLQQKVRQQIAKQKYTRYGTGTVTRMYDLEPSQAATRYSVPARRTIDCGSTTRIELRCTILGGRKAASTGIRMAFSSLNTEAPRAPSTLRRVKSEVCAQTAELLKKV